MTKHYALIGYPLAESPSPAMHNAAFAALGIDAVYELRPLTREELVNPEPFLKNIIAELLTGKLQGINITTPLKTTIFSYLAYLLDTPAAAQTLLTSLKLSPYQLKIDFSENAKAIEALNTLYLEPTPEAPDTLWLRGDNTDILGILTPLQELLAREGVLLAATKPRKTLIIGNGGAARAAILAVKKLDSEIYLAVRDLAKGEKLLTALNLPREQRVLALTDLPSLSQLLPEIDIIIQTTPLSKTPSPWPFPLDKLQRTPKPLAFDVVYSLKGPTSFLEAAKTQGLNLIDGQRMLLEQGIACCALWTKQTPPREIMEQALKRHFLAKSRTCLKTSG